jgi:hypothetical protein
VVETVEDLIVVDSIVVPTVQVSPYPVNGKVILKTLKINQNYK